jgi:hypothetical protein
MTTLNIASAAVTFAASSLRLVPITTFPFSESPAPPPTRRLASGRSRLPAAWPPLEEERRFGDGRAIRLSTGGGRRSFTSARRAPDQKKRRNRVKSGRFNRDEKPAASTKLPGGNSTKFRWPRICPGQPRGRFAHSAPSPPGSGGRVRANFISAKCAHNLVCFQRCAVLPRRHVVVLR